MSRSIFYAVPGFVGAITGEQRCGFWPLQPASLNWDPTKLIPVDLTASPQGVRDGRIAPADVQIDDNLVGQPDPGLTTIGPRFFDGRFEGAAWLESNYYDKLSPSIKPPRVPPDMKCRDYELCSVLYWDGPLAGRRFYGFYAEIVGSNAGLTQVSIWPAGRSMEPTTGPVGTYWIDFGTSAHPKEPGFTQIGTQPGDPQKGALFLDRPTATAIPLDKPKVPKFLGDEAF